MKTKIMMQVLSAALIIQIAFLPDFADAQVDFYRGKTVTTIHGRSAGGSGEMRARAGRDQEGRDCVSRICLELQETPTTKRLTSCSIFLNSGSPVYTSPFPAWPVLRRNNPAKDIFFSTFNSPANFRQLLVGRNYIQGQTQ